MKGAPSADYSVAAVWLARGEYTYLLDLWRERVDYPDLRRAVHRLREKYPTAALLIEDKGSGTSLIQDLRLENVTPIPINPEGDKVARLAAVSVQFESGAVWFPKGAPWLSSLKAELLGFPNVKHDDQVDSISQALSWIKRHRQNQIPFVTPIVVFTPAPASVTSRPIGNSTFFDESYNAASTLTERNFRRRQEGHLTSIE